MQDSQSDLKKRVWMFVLKGVIAFVVVVGIAFVLMNFPVLFLGAGK